MVHIKLLKNIVWFSKIIKFEIFPIKTLHHMTIIQTTVPLIYNFTFTCVYTQGDTTQVL